MADQFSGEMLVGLMRTVERIVSAPHKHSLAEDEELDRLRVLLCGGEETALKTAMMKLIDRLKHENPDPAQVNAAMAEVQRLWPQASLTDSAAIGVDLLE